MLRNWKKLLVIFITIAVLYAGCGTGGMLSTEKFFREDNPNLGLTPTICFMLGTSAYMTLRYKLAIEITERNLKDFPYAGAVPNAEYRRAICYEKLGEYSTAISLLEDFLLKYPRDNRYNSIASKVAKLKALHQQSKQ